MSVRDIFKYNARWDSVGLDCSNCKYEGTTEKWPDINRVYYCKLHKISLSAELNKEGYKEGEWFCKDFQNKGNANGEALREFENIKINLQEKILYGFYSRDGYLKEMPFKKKPKNQNQKTKNQKPKTKNQDAVDNYL